MLHALKYLERLKENDALNGSENERMGSCSLWLSAGIVNCEEFIKRNHFVKKNFY
jgi:hypothetical protein